MRLSFGHDAATLREAGYVVTETPASQPNKGFVEVEVERDGESVLLDWTHDTAIRFFRRSRIPTSGGGSTTSTSPSTSSWPWPVAAHPATTMTSSASTSGASPWWRWHGRPSGRTPDVARARDRRGGSQLGLWPVGTEGWHRPRRGARPGRPQAHLPQGRRGSAGPSSAPGCRDIRHRGLHGHRPDGRLAVPDPDAFARGEITFHPASIGGAWPAVSEDSTYRP